MTLFLSDLDGTLIGKDLVIPKESADGINRAIARGDGFAAATARTPATVEEILAPIHGALPCVVMNGAGVFDFSKGEFVHLASLPTEKEREIRSVLDALGMGGFLYTVLGNHIYVYYDRIENLSQQMFYDMRRIKPRKTFVQGRPPSDVTPVFICVIDNGERTARLAHALKEVLGISFHHYRDAYQEDAWYVEIYDEGASKASGVRFMKEHYGYDKVVCFGDNGNDLAMFEEADESYAVCGAIEALKSAATATLTDPSLEAVGRFIGNYPCEA